MPDYTVTLRLPDIEADNPVMAVESFAHAARQWEQWVYQVRAHETGESWRVDMQSADTGGIVYPEPEGNAVSDALNRAADELADFTWDGDAEDGRDAANLMVSLTLYYLDHPGASLVDAIRACYDDSMAEYLLQHFNNDLSYEPEAPDA